MEQHIDYLLMHYGYFGIIIALIGGIIGLPIPDEVLLTYVGYNVFKGKMAFPTSLVCAFIGAVGGISLSYLIGYKFGLPLLLKYGPKIHITEAKINRTKRLFEKFGPPLLLVGYFIPGIRHLAAYMAAINRYPLKKFIVYAYSGALLWTFTFITLGKKLGQDWILVERYLSKYSIYIILLALILFGGFYVYWRRKGMVGKV